MMNTKAKRGKDREKLFEGTSKIIYYDNENNEIIQFFKDDLRLSDNSIASVLGRGIINNNISSNIMAHLNMLGINNHFIEKLNMREQLVELAEAIPLKICVANLANGRYVDDFILEAGYVFNQPMIDWQLKLHNKPTAIINEMQIINLEIATKQEIKLMQNLAYRINDFLYGLFSGLGLRLIECQLEFGRSYTVTDEIMLIGEISPDTCKISDINTNQRFDYENITEQTVDAINIYQQVASRLNSYIGG